VDVAQRIADFRALYPAGCLQPADLTSPWEIATVTGTDKNGEVAAQTFIVYVAAAYRTPDDSRPGIGAAWEIWPGRTPYTRGSELMNAETSAWGRAIIAVLASDSKAGVASRQEVEARRAERDDGLPTNADGSLSRSRTTDAEKASAGVMTDAQQKEHTALGGGHPNERKMPAAERGNVHRLPTTPPGDPWTDQPAGKLPDTPEHKPGSIGPGQRTKIMTAYSQHTREARLVELAGIVGRPVGSVNDLSYTEAQLVLAKMGKAAVK
jgi:hypothetical protein